MLRHARLAASAARNLGTPARAGRDWLTGPLTRGRRTLVVAGAALALAGASSASAAVVRQAPATAGLARAHRTGTRPAAHPPWLAGPFPDRPAQPHASPAVRPAGAGPRAGNPGSRASAVGAKPGVLPPADQLMPVGPSGPQSSMPISGAQLANATTIVRRTMAMRMGMRSAVIAVATAMQESRLLNLGYGTADSVGLFQQRPSAGWGTAQQIMNPGYAATAFLSALQRHQASDPGWAAQPLWTSAQAVQASGVPFAYARWEAQAASLVRQIAAALH